jgi:hypothetical protein
LHTRVEVVDVGRRREPVAGVAVACAVRVRGVVAADHAGAPVEAVVGRPALEDAVDAARVLLVSAPVVYDDVRHALDAPAVERRDQGLELRRRAVLGRVQVVEAPRHVTLGRDGVRGWRQPDVRDAGLGDVVDLGLEAVVPAALLLARLPVKPLLEQMVSW